MKLLTDLHHGGLFEASALLFEDRFGWDLYRPIGMEWYRQGYWQHPLEEVAHQFLDHLVGDTLYTDHSERSDPSHPPRVHKLVTVDQARALGLNFTLATLTENQEGYYRFAREVGAKAGIQVGNMWSHNRWELADFGLLSVKLEDRRGIEGVPHVEYHQEFDLRLFHPGSAEEKTPLAATWVNCLSDMPPFYEMFAALAADVPELTWKCYGHYRPENAYWDRFLDPVGAVAASMRSARVAVQFKYGDGMGHVVHNLFACGLPVVATPAYYRQQMAGPLFVDMVNSIDAQLHPPSEVAAWVRRLALDDEFRQKVGDASYRRFREVVDFAADAEKVRGLLERVVS